MKSGVALNILKGYFDAAKSQLEFDIIYLELSKPGKAGDLWKLLNDTSKNTLMNHIHKVEEKFTV